MEVADCRLCCILAEIKAKKAKYMNYKIIDIDKYYRRDVFRHFSQDCKCSISMTSHLDVTNLESCSRNTGTKFYINFLYVLAKVLNSREDYRMGYLWRTQQIIVYDKINPTQYIFHEATESCTPVYTEYHNNYECFYSGCVKDIVKAKQSQEYALDMENHPNWFDASYISWLSYDSLHIELPDGYLYFMPIVNWGRYREEDGRLIMPVSVRLNHATADGYLLAKVFLLLQEKIVEFTR
jgi:chloramphenicol O-acetyltransferase type A